MVARRLGRTFVLSFLFAALGCERKPAVDIVVKVARDGRASVGGEAVTMDELLRLLRQKTERCPRDADGLSVFSVEISAHPECEYRHVQDIMRQCMKVYVWRITWEMGGKRQEAVAPRDPFPPFRHPSDAPPGRRVMVYWANAAGRVIHSPSQAFPHDWPGVRMSVSTAGAHVAVQVSKIEFEKVLVVGGWSGLAHIIKHRTVELPGPGDIEAKVAQATDLDELARTLADLTARDPDAYVIIDGRRAVPFRWVFDMLRACKRAKVRNVVPGVRARDERDDDWFCM